MRSQLDLPPEVARDVDRAIPSTVRFSLSALPEPLPAREQPRVVQELQGTLADAFKFHSKLLSDKVVATMGLTHDVVTSAVRAGITKAKDFEHLWRERENTRINEDQKVAAIMHDAAKLSDSEYKLANRLLMDSRLADEWAFEPTHLSAADRKGASFTRNSPLAQRYNRLSIQAKKAVRARR